MVAFANSLGGTLLIGVDDKGVIIGADTSNRAKSPRFRTPAVILSLHSMLRLKPWIMS